MLTFTNAKSIQIRLNSIVSSFRDGKGRLNTCKTKTNPNANFSSHIRRYLIMFVYCTGNKPKSHTKRESHTDS